VTNQEWTYLIAGVAGGLALIAWAALVLVPAWASYSRLWERLVATILSVYVLVAFLMAGTGLGAAILWYYNEI
jgi:hypothetical protein